MATIKDIANAAGVSTGAVSRILNNDETLSVAVQTREKVLTIAREMGYKSVAQRYSQTKTNKKQEINIGIAQMYEMERLQEDIYYMVMKNAVDNGAFSKSWNTETLLRDEKGRFVKNSNRKLDGIIAIGQYTESEIKNFESYTKNIVFIDSSPDEMKYYSVTPNYHLAVRLALKKFEESGCKQIAYAGAVYTYDSNKVKSIDPRYYYYRNTLSLKECFDEKLVLDCNINNSKCGYETMNQYLADMKKPPEAIFISSDAVAPGVVKALQENGFAIPKDTSIITYNNTTLSKACNPPIDSIEVYMKEYADAAMESMEKLWKNKGIPRRVTIPCSLVERGSVK